MAANSNNVAGCKDVLTGAQEAPTGAAQVSPASAPELKSLLAIAVGTLAVAALYFAQDVLVPITLAIVLSFGLFPVVAFLQRLRLPRAPAVIVAVLAALGVLGGMGRLIGSQEASLAKDAPRYARTIKAEVEGVQAFAAARLASLTQGAAGPRPVRLVLAADRPALTGAETRAVPVRMVEEHSTPLPVAKAVLAPVLADRIVGEMRHLDVSGPRDCLTWRGDPRKAALPLPLTEADQPY